MSLWERKNLKKKKLLDNDINDNNDEFNIQEEPILKTKKKEKK